MPRGKRKGAPRRRLPVGAEVLPGGTHFRVWAPRRRRVEAVLEDADGAPTKVVELAAEPGGYFSGWGQEAGAGTRYRYRLDGDGPFPDLASRFQPVGPGGPSEVVDPSTFAWTDAAWGGIPAEGQVIYEMHVGTFTPEGTWDAACRELPELRALGITVVEVMPVAEFPGRFGWGYDGVDLFAPTRLYGAPDDFRRFVDCAHGLGLAVILDVVYNHVGPLYSFFREYATAYFSDRYPNEWGEALNFDGADSAPVREFFVANAGYWVDEFHCDGLRLDATQQVFDASPEHVLAAVRRRVQAAAGRRRTYVVGENEPQRVQLLRPPEQGGAGLEALWNDDFHHSAVTALTGRNEAYYSDYRGTPQEFVSAAKRAFLYQGQRSTWQGKPRGTPTAGVAPARFINFLQNHDQVANSGRGQRLHASTTPGRYRAATALLLLLPGTPMLFQGQEFCADSPFLYFADHEEGLAGKVARGRREFLAQFPLLASPEMQPLLADPADPATFMRSKLDLAERQSHAAAYALHKDLLALRSRDPVFRTQGGGGVDGAVLGPEAFCLRFFGEAGDDRLLVMNLGLTCTLHAAPEPLLAPPAGRQWSVLWSSEHPKYGGEGVPAQAPDQPWRLLGHAALVYAATEAGTHG
ncbi:MAG: malto-oligosyltrehalose trehalohydrolase [Candidatus Methylomirabilales bacterium]